MKNTILIFAMLFSSCLYAQDATHQTTQEEYNWVDSGCTRDDSHYKLQDLGQWGHTNSNLVSSSDREFDFKAVYRNNWRKPIAILVIYTKNGHNENTYCIPTENADQSMWDKTLEELDEVELPTEMYKALSLALMHMATNNIEEK